MKTTLDAKKAIGVGDEAVKKATSRSWPEWFTLLDRAGAKKMTHQEIVAVLHDQFGVGAWWQQMVTVGYEQARGLREKHEKPDGFEVSVSKTLAAPLTAAFRAWTDAAQRQLWLEDAGFTVRKATANKSLRLTWVDGKTSVAVSFHAKGKGKCQVAAQHAKLRSATAARRMKTYWKTQLEKLASQLGAGR